MKLKETSFEVEDTKIYCKKHEILKSVFDKKTRFAEMSDMMEKSHQEVRRDVTSVLEQHHDSRTARSIGDAVGDYFKQQWAQINQV